MNAPRLIINVNEKGQIGLDGPIDNKMLCVFLLSEATRLLEKYHDDKAAGKEQSRIMIPDLKVPNGL